MNKRVQQLENNRLEKLNKEVTMVLQSLQWNREQIVKGVNLASCRYDSSHTMPVSALEEHEERCFLNINGYSKDEILLPDPINTISSVKLSNEDIQKIMNGTAASLTKQHCMMEAGARCRVEPLSLSRLQQTYDGATRRAIHDAVRAAAPDSTRFTLTTTHSRSGDAGACSDRPGDSRLHTLAAARDLRRRRARYRGAPTANYSDTLRGVIHSQTYLEDRAYSDIVKQALRHRSYRDIFLMEVYTDAHKDSTKYDIKQSKYKEKVYYRGKSPNETRIEKRVSRKSSR